MTQESRYPLGDFSFKISGFSDNYILHGFLFKDNENILLLRSSLPMDSWTHSQKYFSPEKKRQDIEWWDKSTLLSCKHLNFKYEYFSQLFRLNTVRYIYILDATRFQFSPM